MISVEQMLNPDAHGLKVCGHCNGYGSSLKEESDKCSVCGGSGLLPKSTDKKTDLEEQQNLEQLAVELDYEALRAGKKKLDDMTVPDLRAVHAYEGWKDGMEWEDVMALWLGTNDLYSSREEILDQLINVYGY